MHLILSLLSIDIPVTNDILSHFRPVLELHLIGEGVQGTKILVTELNQMSDYNQPHAPGALLKAAFICADVIQYPSTQSLSDQLTKKYQGGFELHTWSNLPHGSGKIF